MTLVLPGPLGRLETIVIAEPGRGPARLDGGRRGLDGALALIRGVRVGATWTHEAARP